jgi:hypothetical protein
MLPTTRLGENLGKNGEAELAETAVSSVWFSGVTRTT